MSESTGTPSPVALSIDQAGEFEVVSVVGADTVPKHRKGSKRQRDLPVVVEVISAGFDVSSTRRIRPGVYEVVLTKVVEHLAAPGAHLDADAVESETTSEPLASQDLSNSLEQSAHVGESTKATAVEMSFDADADAGSGEESGDQSFSLPPEVAREVGELKRLPDQLGSHLEPIDPSPAGAMRVSASPLETTNEQALRPVAMDPAAMAPLPPPTMAAKKRWYQRSVKGPTLVVGPTRPPGPLSIPEGDAGRSATGRPERGSQAHPMSARAPTLVLTGQQMPSDRESNVQRPLSIDPSTGLPAIGDAAGPKDLGRNWRGQKVTEDPQIEIPPRPLVPLWESFLADGLVTVDQLDHAYATHFTAGVTVTEALVAEGAADESALVQAIGRFSGLEVCDLPRATLDPAALDLLPESIAREHRIFPLRILPDEYIVALAEPSEKLQSLLSQASGIAVTILVARPTEIVAAIDQHYHALFGINELVEEFEADEGTRRRVTAVAPTELEADNAPIVRLVNRILSQAMRDGASDVHIEPADEVVRVRNRVDGVLKVVLVLPAAMGLGLVSRIKIMAEMNIVERRRPQDGTFTIELDGRAVDVRVATVATIFGESCVLRLLDKTKSLLSISDLGMAPAAHAAYSKMIRAPFGMVLCVGPTGSGKTTTLYASLNEISDVARNVMTIEDPVEYVFPSINQIQTNEQAGLTFATGLKSILRQDSDVVLVGEIRDVETARIAVQSTLTGHFVLSSIHATDAIGALTRFIDMGIEPFLIASSLVGLVGQRLVRRTCRSCSEPYEPTEVEMDFYRRGGGPDKDVFVRGAGCNTCGHTGYKGRVGVYELVPMTPEMKRLIVGFATEQELRDLAQKQGLRTMQAEAIDLITRDITTPAEVIRSIYAL